MINVTSREIPAVEDRFGRLVCARLDDTTSALPYDISERLRASRERALSQRKLAPQIRPAVAMNSNGGSATLTLGDGEQSPLGWLASLVPLLLLLVGLLMIQWVQDDNRASELADVDTALLTDDLPTAAYTDPGFLEFLKTNRESTQ
ncbi:DUF3619 family protein [Variovorax sp. HJSM1_2]|uniref:DUF3619 family protein n=1 Tax=Variovorax sp. HJSM1_2 TaxID=3366263 RepID=UPI003BCCB1EB